MAVLPLSGEKKCRCSICAMHEKTLFLPKSNNKDTDQKGADWRSG